MIGGCGFRGPDELAPHLSARVWETFAEYCMHFWHPVGNWNSLGAFLLALTATDAFAGADLLRHDAVGVPHKAEIVMHQPAVVG